MSKSHGPIYVLPHIRTRRVGTNCGELLLNEELFSAKKLNFPVPCSLNRNVDLKVWFEFHIRKIGNLQGLWLDIWEGETLTWIYRNSMMLDDRFYLLRFSVWSLLDGKMATKNQ